MPRDRQDIEQIIRDLYHCDQKALEIAKAIDDIYAVGGLHVAQRTSKIQLRIKDALVSWVRDAFIRNDISLDDFK